MPCPVCNLLEGKADHRMCIKILLDNGEIEDTEDWIALCNPKPKTIVLGKKIWITVPKVPKQPSLKGTP
jgi:hypothetical protein